MSNQLEKIKELIERRAVARIGGGEKAIAKQHEKGKYTARERLAMLLDEGSFEEMDMFVEHRCTNELRNGEKTLSGRRCSNRLRYNRRTSGICVRTGLVSAGSLSETMSLKICKFMDQAMMGAPCIGINDSGGARIRKVSTLWQVMQKSSNASLLPVLFSDFGLCRSLFGGSDRLLRL